MNLTEIAACAAAFISALTYLKNIRDKRFDKIENSIKDNLDKLEKKIDEGFRSLRIEINDLKYETKIEFQKVHHDLTEIKERISFIEGTIFFREFSSDPNARSEAAKKAWDKRRNKKVTNG